MVRRERRDRLICRRIIREIYRFALSLPPRAFFSVFLALFLLLLMLACYSQPVSASDEAAQKTPKINAKAKFSFGYDNNVSERKTDKTESRFLQFYVNSGMYMLPADRTLLSLKLQNGLKYLDASSLSGESVLINGLNANLSYKLSDRLMPEIQSEIRGRTSIHNESGVSPSEEAYLRGSIGASLKAIAMSDITGKVFCRYKFINFGDFDPFDRRGPQIGLGLDVRLLPDSTVSLQYSRAEGNLNKWDMLSPEAKSSRTDISDTIIISAQIYKYFLFDLTYSYQNNNSDIDGYSYHANTLTLLMAKHLPHDIMFQLYALTRSRKYSSSDEPVFAQVELEDDERGVLTVKLSRDINADCSLEVQCDLRRSSSHSENGLYTKGVLSSSLSFHF